MNKYEGITLPIYEPWDCEKYRALPARRWGEGGSQNTSLGGGVGERKCIKHVKMSPNYDNTGTRWEKEKRRDVF